jgi:hypothetical protein
VGGTHGLRSRLDGGGDRCCQGHRAACLGTYPENIELVWDEVAYQVEAGFLHMVPEVELFAHGYPSNMKVSRLAVVPQRNRQGRLILNLSAGVELPLKRIPGSWRSQKRAQASVNETTSPAEDQEAVKRLGNTMADALLFQFESPCHWEVRWSKIDLSNGFWRMIVQAGQENNFVYELPDHPKHPGKWFVVPSALQMGWTNSPAFFLHRDRSSTTSHNAAADAINRNGRDSTPFVRGLLCRAKHNRVGTRHRDAITAKGIC